MTETRTAGARQFFSRQGTLSKWHPNFEFRPGQLEILNEELAGAMARSQVVPTDSGFTWLWAEGGKALDCVLWPIARSAADLLTEGPLLAIRRCEGRGCGWLFLDTSRNRTRRWCDMRICGNRAKARRHHERMKAGAA